MSQERAQMAQQKLFADMAEISEVTLEVLHRLGYTRATPVQEAVIPLFSGYKDVAVDACTGSGKTLAFVVPLIDKLRRMDDPLKQHQVGAIIVSPTRELARQIHEVALPFVQSVPGLTSALFVGGSDPTVDVAAFRERGAHVLVGTPGRLADVMKRCTAMDVRRLEVFVLDEADRLLDMGFRHQLDFIMTHLPKQRRTGLFSATQTEAVQALARAGLRNPIRVNVAVKSKAQPRKGEPPGSATQRTPSSLTIQYAFYPITEKLGRLVEFLQEHRDSKVIVYMLTCACVDFFATVLAQLPEAAGLRLVTLHGRMKQAAREAHLADYAAGEAGCLLCTDVAARGLDIPDVDWIVQYDAPQDPDAFVHRVGRTARMGRSGNALVMLLPSEEAYVDFLKLRKVPLEEAPPRASEPAQVLSGIRALSGGDRDVMQKGTRAFVSFVRGYKEHHCRYIFRLQDLQLGHMATAFGLLRLPRMSETNGPLEGFTPSLVDPDTVKFKDRVREKQRRKLLAQMAAEGVKKPFREPAAEKEKPVAEVEKVRRLPAARRRTINQRQDLEDLTDEYRLFKKLKKGKLSEHDFDVAMGLAEDDLDFDDGEKDGEKPSSKPTRQEGKQSGRPPVKGVPKGLGLGRGGHGKGKKRRKGGAPNAFR